MGAWGAWGAWKAGPTKRKQSFMMAPMKVIHSCTSKSFSGLERYVLDLVCWQHQQGFPVELFCRTDSELQKKAAERGVATWTIPADSSAGPLLWFRMRKQWNARTKAGPVTLHMHAGGEPWFHLPWLLKKSAVKVILQIHLWINHSKKDPVHQFVYKNIDEVWCSTESARAHLSKLFPVKPSAFRVVHYGRDLKSLKEKAKGSKARAELGINEDAVLAVTVARLEKIKGIHELFDAFVEVAPRFPNANLLVIGDASPENAEAETYARILREKHASLPEDIRQRLRMPGYLDGVESYLAASDFYVLPSYEECMSLALLDALILGRPAIGTNTGGTPSVVRPDETGYLVNAQDAHGLAAVFRKVFSNPEKLKSLSENARKLGTQYDREEIFRKIWDSYTI